MMMTPEKWQRYIDNQCTEAERKEIFYYLQQTPPETILHNDWEENAPPMPVDAANRLDGYVRIITRNRILKIRYWAAACIIAALFGISLLWTQQKTTATATIIQNATAVVKKVTLPDSSQVWLTPQSALSLEPGYAISNRQLSLKGEAYFEVVHNEAQPFMVDAGGVRTKVLGTHFNIESYSGETGTTISLTTGKVAVSIHDSLIILTPGNRFVYLAGKKQFHTEVFSPTQETDWKNGAIVLNDLPIQDVFRRLEHRFGKVIHYNARLLKEKRFITATYQHADLELILRNMAFVQGFRYEIAADTVFIH